MISRKNIIGILAISSIAVLAGLTVVHVESAPADDLLKQAYELRMQARRQHCISIGVKIALAYAGDKEARNEVPKSAVWFLNEYGQTHEVACLADDLPFGVGGR